MPPSYAVFGCGDFEQRQRLYSICTQKGPLEDFLPQASEIIPRLFISDLWTASDHDTLIRLGITHVISVVKHLDVSYFSSIKHTWVPVLDRRGENLSQHFGRIVRKINKALDGKKRKNNKVLVHCVWGMSRSPSLVMAYLMATHGMSFQKALQHVKSKRAVVKPNAGFETQLSIYGRSLKSKSDKCASLMV